MSDSQGEPGRHASGFAITRNPDARCESCAWLQVADGGDAGCSQAPGVCIEPGDLGCERFAAELDCLACGACCREAFEQVSISAQDPVIELHPRLVRLRGGAFELARVGQRCAALEDSPSGHSCTIYPDRPRSCRTFEAGSARCLAARERVGLGT